MDGKLEGLGFIVRDSVCTQKILNALPSSDSYSWISPNPEQLALTPKVAVEQKESELTKRGIEYYINPGEIPKHIEDDDASTGLVVMTILIWIATIVATAFCCMQSMKMRSAMRAMRQGQM